MIADEGVGESSAVKLTVILLASVMVMGTLNGL